MSFWSSRTCAWPDPRSAPAPGTSPGSSQTDAHAGPGGLFVGSAPPGYSGGRLKTLRSLARTTMGATVGTGSPVPGGERGGPIAPRPSFVSSCRGIPCRLLACSWLKHKARPRTPREIPKTFLEIVIGITGCTHGPYTIDVPTDDRTDRLLFFPGSRTDDVKTGNERSPDRHLLWALSALDGWLGARPCTLPRKWFEVTHPALPRIGSPRVVQTTDWRRPEL